MLLDSDLINFDNVDPNSLKKNADKAESGSRTLDTKNGPIKAVSTNILDVLFSTLWANIS